MEFLNNLRFELQILIYKLQGHNDPRVATDIDLKLLQDDAPQKYASEALKPSRDAVLPVVQQLNDASAASKADQGMAAVKK